MPTGPFLGTGAAWSTIWMEIEGGARNVAAVASAQGRLPEWVGYLANPAVYLTTAGLFPPNMPPQKGPTLSVTGATEGAVIPVAWGRAVVPGLIVYFDYSRVHYVSHGRTGPDTYAPVHIILCHGPVTLFAAWSQKNEDWFETNRRLGGVDYSLSTPPHTLTGVGGSTENTTSLKAFGYAPAAFSKYASVSGIWSPSFFIGTGVSGMTPLLFDLECKPCTTVDPNTGYYRGAQIPFYANPRVTYGNPFGDLPGGDETGDNMIVRAITEERLRKEWRFEHPKAGTDGNLYIPSVASMQAAGLNLPWTIQLRNGPWFVNPAEPWRDATSHPARSIGAMISNPSITPRLMLYNEQVEFSPGTDWQWYQGDNGASGKIVIPSGSAVLNYLPNWFHFKGSYLDEGGYRGANPAACYYDLITNDIWGMGIDPANVDFEAFRGAHQQYQQEKVAFNEAVDSQQSGEQLIKNMNFCSNSMVRITPGNQIQLYPIRMSYFVPSLQALTYSVDEDAISECEFAVNGPNSTFGEFIGTFRMGTEQLDSDGKYWREPKEPVNSIKLSNDAVIEETKQRRQKVYRFDFFSDARLVNGRLTQLKKLESFPVSGVKMKLPKGTASASLYALRPGDLLSISHSRFNLTNTLFRVIDVKDSELGEIAMEIEAVLEVENLYSNYVDPVSDPEGAVPSSSPADPLGVILFTAHWQFHGSFPDWDADLRSSRGMTARFDGGYKTIAAVSQGKGTDPFAIAAVYDDYRSPNDNLPGQALGNTALRYWGYKFSLMNALREGDWTIASTPNAAQIHSPQSIELGNQTVILRLETFPGGEFPFGDHSGQDSSGFHYDQEGDPWVLVFGGREMMRWKYVSEIGAGLTESARNALLAQYGLPAPTAGDPSPVKYYEFREVLRGCNKEALYDWPALTTVWALQLVEPGLEGNAYESWAGRQRYVALEQYQNAPAPPPTNANQSQRRIEIISQAVSASGQVQDESEGIKRILKKRGDVQDASAETDAHNMYSNVEEITAQIAPMCAAFAVRFGDGILEASPTVLNPLFLGGAGQQPNAWYTYITPIGGGNFDHYYFPQTTDTSFGISGVNFPTGKLTDGDWLIFFQPIIDDYTGIGDRIIYDLVDEFQQPIPAPSDFDKTPWPLIQADQDPSAIAASQQYAGQIFRLQVRRYSDGAVLFSHEITLNDPSVKNGAWARWPVFIYRASAQTVSIGGSSYAFDKNKDYFEVSRKSSNLRFDGGASYSRPSIATKIGPWQNTKLRGREWKDLAATSYIQVTNPNGGQSFAQAFPMAILWLSSGIVGNVKIDLVRDTGEIVPVAASVANTGSIIWAVSAAAASNYRVRVASVSNSAITDSSDTTFTIT